MGSQQRAEDTEAKSLRVNLTPVDTGAEGFPGETGVSRNAKNPGKSGVFRVCFFPQSDDLTN
jgi:hypothetical protein